MIHELREFHVRREPRERYGVNRTLLGSRGDLVIANVPAVRRLAGRMNAERSAGAPAVHAGELFALGLIHEVGHILIHRYEQQQRPGAIKTALSDLQDRLGPDAKRLLDRFAQEFPGRGPNPEPAAHRLEELLLTRISNENPALGPLHELVDDRALAKGTRYAEAIAELEQIFSDGPASGLDGVSLIELMRLPARHAPTSLSGQLRFIRDRWGDVIGDNLADLLDRLDLAIGILAEEERGLHLRFGLGGPATAEAPSFAGAADEPEAFSSDSAWMPRVVLMAKSTYVWLDQLSRTYGRHIGTLDAIPDTELDTLARWGVTGLWLIGLWERSPASERIKRMRGNAEAVASAYSLDDYQIAADLGGEAAFAALRDRATARGIRLASDMVPNHMGIDSRWVIDHPEWFLSVPEPPFPAYSFTGADLSHDERVGIVLEDHYWNDTDAAVVFKRFDRWSGDERYVYHGNDGTSFPWNDTAQLNFLDPAVREQVIRTILDVARRFPIIRFDAAMVLAKKHIERLWWPEPGEGGGIPSRAEHAMSKAEFERGMPTEFWRQVVDRVAAEVPGTLLLAEAFWLLEGYFVRTLGMHRVYNSAFMHMLRDENGAGYRKVIRETIEFDPEILKRYVNFMSNPDEKTALEQFGKGDKYFGVATVLATLPGLPMLGHGQVQGFGEKYGMEFRRATLEEQPDGGLVSRHEREIFPLLHRRAWFAEAHDFLLYDFVTEGGTVDENVFAYSNGRGRERSLVVFHDRFASTTGSIRESAAYAAKAPDGKKRLVRRSLAEGLGLPNEEGAFVVLRDARTGLETLHASRDLWERGLRLSLDAYGTHVFWELRDVHDGSARQWSRLARRLNGAAVPSVDDAMRELQLQPLHQPLRALLADGFARSVADGTAKKAAFDEIESRYRSFLAAVAEATAVDGNTTQLAKAVRAQLAATVAGGFMPAEPVERAALLAWIALRQLGELAPGSDVEATSRAWFDELRLAAPLAAGLHELGLDEGDAWAAADLVRVLLALPRPSRLGGAKRTADGRLLDAWLSLDVVRTAIGVNTWQGVEYVGRDGFEGTLRWAERLDAIDSLAIEAGAGRKRVPAATTLAKAAGFAERLGDVARLADYRVDRMRAALAGAPPAPVARAQRGSKPQSRPSQRTPKRASAEQDPPQE